MLEDPPVNGPLTPILIGSAACADQAAKVAEMATAASR